MVRTLLILTLLFNVSCVTTDDPVDLPDGTIELRTDKLTKIRVEKIEYE